MKLTLFLMIFILNSCLSPSVERRDLSSEDDGTPVVSTGDLVTLPNAENFMQLSSVQYTATMELSSDFNDNFLIRGNEIIKYLNEVDKTTASFCMPIHFLTGTKKLVILKLKIMTYLNYINGKTEYYFQAFPGNTTENKSTCQDANLLNLVNLELNTNYLLSDVAFSLNEVCPNCTSSILSQGLRLYKNKNEKIALTISSLNLRLKPATGNSNNTGPSCLANETCTGSGYTCCLNNQCVKEAAIKANVNLTDPDYLTAASDVNLTPSNYKNYPEYYYICPIGSGNNGGETPTNPSAEANETLKTKSDLYNCLNPPEGEDLSVCTKKILNASSLIGTTGTVISVSADDLTMSSINPLITDQNIVEIDYSGNILYKKDNTPLASSNGSFLIGTENDNLTLSQDVFINATLASNAPIDILRVKYNVLGTCRSVSSAIAKCTKIYKQGQVSTPAKSTDHATSNTFKLPSFADTSYNLIVKVGDIITPQDATTWNLSGQNLVFTQNVTANQKVEITFFVTTNASVLTSSINQAQSELNTLCGFEDAYLEPVINPETNTTDNYTCLQNVDGSIDPTFQGIVYLDTKTVPHKFYDTNGAYWTPDMISEAGDQEGNAFEYIGNNVLRPNNVNSAIGFNEIYGSFKKGQTPPLPSKVITVKKNQIYDIYTDNGSFSTCSNCGSDYFSSLQRVFPEVFTSDGGGYTPDPVQTSRTSNFGKYRSDDLLFGRACFVPATMIPWTHRASSDVQTQRLNRLKAQHFLFANGYNRDWYGFDYGSVIGSFDGVTWFSIGSARRITAKSNKLYLAINAYFGDQSINNSYKIQIQESAGIPGVGPEADHDTETDGAQCQQNHFCSTDQDCVGNLGYDYVCESVTGIKTSWPIIDSQGNEEIGSKEVSISSLVAGTNGQTRRCVYRGKGSPCERGDIYNLGSSFNQSLNPMMVSCSPNNYCASLTTNKFNSKIARFAASPQNQNASSYITDKTDQFSLNARILGRPYNLIASENADGLIVSHLNSVGVKNICVPGRTPNYATSNLINLNQSAPPIRDVQTDEVGNIGSTMTDTISANQGYYLACPAFDKDGNFINRDNNTNTLQVLRDAAAEQNISTNLLTHSDFSGLGLFSETESPRKNIGLDKNACLRAPGASCFTDFDCAGNPWISSKIRNLANFLNLNTPEQEFWKTEFICGNPDSKYTDQSQTINPDFDLANNRCCRGVGLDFTNYSQEHENSTFTSSFSSSAPAVPAVNINFQNDQRYSAHQIAYSKIKNDTNYNALRVPAASPGTPFTLTDILKQYNTLHEVNSKMCCTGNWVRNFSDANGGGHAWAYNRSQNISRSIFKYINWVQDTDGNPFRCDYLSYATSDCEIRYISEGSSYETTTLNWLGRLELAGIPQITIDPNEVPALVDENQDALVGRPLGYTDSGEELIKDFASGTVDATKDAVFVNDGVNDHFSLNDENDYGSRLKKVFSDKDFSCCQPSGSVVSSSVTDNMCCTGKVDTIQTGDKAGNRQCCLPKWTDISVYLNRYVSSEGASLGESAYDTETGYIKNPEVVKQIALERGLCCSGRVAMGVAIFNLQTPIFDSAGNPIDTGLNENAFSRRFVSGSANDINEVFNNTPKTKNIGNIYDVGVRWNNHVYCVDAVYPDPYDP